MENVHPIYSIKELMIKRELAKNPDMKDENCTICVSKYQIGENVTELNCKHIFHTECISEWVKYKSECPVCRQSIDTIDERTDNNEVHKIN
jgi:hypothetical protein